VSSKDPSKKLGVIRFKLRMRKTLSEALKWYKEKTTLEAINSEKIVEKTTATSTTAANKTVTI